MFRPVSFALVALSAAACVEVPAPEAETEERTVQALVLVERTEGEGDPLTSVSAKFMRSLASDRAATEALVGARLALPGAFECVAEQQLVRDGASSRPRAGVELIDVGDVTLRTLEPSPTSDPFAAGLLVREIELAPRAFPDVGDVASGVFYTSADTAEALPAPATYALGGSGTPSIDAFTLEAVAPPTLGEITLQGRTLDEIDEVGVAQGGDVLLAWLPTVASDDARVYLDVRADDGIAFRCAYPDAGAATIPASMLAGHTEISISLHRVVDRALVVDLTDQQDRTPVTVRFDFAQQARVPVRAGGASAEGAAASAVGHRGI